MHIVHIESKPRQVLQTLLTMYRCSSRVLAEPEAGLPTKCSTDHISCFETSHSEKGTLSLNRKLACFEKNAKIACLSFSYALCRSVCFGKGELRPPCRATLGKQFRQAWSNRVEMPPFVKQFALSLL